MKSSHQERLIISKEPSSHPVNELIRIGEECLRIKEDFDTFSNSERAVRMAFKKKCTKIIGFDSERLVLSTLCGNQLLSSYKFRITSSVSYKEINLEENRELNENETGRILPPEKYARYAVLTLGLNQTDAKFMYHFWNSKIAKIDLDAIEYALVVEAVEDSFVLKYVRIASGRVEVCGPVIRMELVEKYHNDELYSSCLVKKKTTKNVTKNATKDVVGKIYLNKQDLKDIKLRKK
ncbi:hypothetical protein ECANGB1_2780 [Enterospora canceri]|uniref:Ribosome biogenesis protein RPF2 homolog n=1 Tax=Enterospora canceri TaxID=1081671 RepID=A0A1Y1S9D5_9MICR|nr:hypothetical protein ECANGB1_2780 [Enterospora canceri]